MISWRVYSRYGGALLKGEGGYFIEELFLLQCSLSHVFEKRAKKACLPLLVSAELQWFLFSQIRRDLEIL